MQIFLDNALKIFSAYPSVEKISWNIKIIEKNSFHQVTKDLPPKIVLIFTDSKLLLITSKLLIQ